MSSLRAITIQRLFAVLYSLQIPLIFLAGMHLVNVYTGAVAWQNVTATVQHLHFVHLCNYKSELVCGSELNCHPPCLTSFARSPFTSLALLVLNFLFNDESGSAWAFSDGDRLVFGQEGEIAGCTSVCDGMDANLKVSILFKSIRHMKVVVCCGYLIH